MKKLVDEGIIKFYIRCVDDILLLIKMEDIDRVHKAFESFDKNLRFTYDSFDNDTPHFLNILISPRGHEIYRKPTFSGMYTKFHALEI